MTADDTVKALTSAVSVARFAPSIHNTQPWRWSLGRDELELYADQSRQLEIGDADGRLMVLSCGAALHYALTALRGQGYPHPTASRAGGRSISDGPLARINAGEAGETSPEALESLRLMMYRHTDRWPVLDEPVPSETLDRLQDAAENAGGHFHILSDSDVTELSAITGEAQRIISADTARLEEMDAWGEQTETGVGVPEDAVNPDPGRVRVPPRRFGRVRPRQATSVDRESASDRSATYGVIFTDHDDVPSWLSAGEAVSALWLTATAIGLSVEPFSEPIEVDTTRSRLAGLLSGLGTPLLVLRLGWATEPGKAPATPRLSLEEILGHAAEHD